MKSVNELIEGYFEGTLSQDEETALKVFLASEEGQGPEYDEVCAVMGYFAAGRAVIFGNTKAITSRRSLRLREIVWRRIAAIAASLAIIITLGVSLYNKTNVCVSYVSGQKITDKEVVMNDVDNILADLLSDRTDMEEQLTGIFGE
ncbi:MAG: hypothetical protein IKH00_10040 [Bacteroidales bacterium]|nr:hypothetical protein [Bacteroidales bacterium]